MWSSGMLLLILKKLISGVDGRPTLTPPPSTPPPAEKKIFTIYDEKTRRKFLVDSGAEISLVPARYGLTPSNQGPTLYAANGTKIPTYSTQTLKLSLSLNRDFQWDFIIAKVD